MERIKNYTDFVFEGKTISVSMIVPNDVEKMAILFNNAGKDFYVVGGACRNFLQNKIPHDYDLVTNALPEESKSILSDWNVSDEQGKNFGVLRIYTKDEPLGYELAVYRTDVSKGRDTKGNDEKVKFGKSIGMVEDSKRRDFTINALYYDVIKKEIVDLVGGVDDIKNNIIRAVGNPIDRFNEDRLRICRLFRLSASNHCKIDKDTANAIKNDNRLRGISAKDDVSQERIVEEFAKMSEYCISHNDQNAWNNYLNLLSDFDMWEQMFPNVKTSKKVQNNDTTNLTITYTFLFDENNPTFEFQSEMIHKLKIPSKIANGVIFLLNYSIYAGSIDSIYSLKKMHNRYKTSIDDETIKEFSELIDVDNKFTDAFLKYNFTVNGNDVMKDGFKGLELGDEIQRREKEIFIEILNERI